MQGGMLNITELLNSRPRIQTWVPHFWSELFHYATLGPGLFNEVYPEGNTFNRSD